MRTVPYHWLSFSESNPAKGRWDQAWIERILSGQEGRPAHPAPLVEVDTWNPEDGGVVVFPAGHYAETNTVEYAMAKLYEIFERAPYLLLIATSDECSLFPWGDMDIPPHVRLWVQTPRAENHYPHGTRFLPLGSPYSAQEMLESVADPNQMVDVFFAGQNTHQRRADMAHAFGAMSRRDFNLDFHYTDGFARGWPKDIYQSRMARTKIAPAPTGPCTQDTFRLHEALEAQAVPIADVCRPDWYGAAYWARVGMLGIMPLVSKWEDGPSTAADLLKRWPDIGNQVQSKWQMFKRDVVRTLHRDIQALGGEQSAPSWADEITVIVPTSPVPSNPSLDTIQTTIESVRRILPDAEILITCDGVREEQADRMSAYHEFIRLLLRWTAVTPNTYAIVHHAHMHQSGMMRHAIPKIDTHWLMYVEHDCPLVGDINIDHVIACMDEDDINVMRFHHDVSIHHQSEHLYLETTPGERPYLRTVQWSQRPHIARVDWYRDVMRRYFGAESRTMIEDVLHGVIQHTFTGNRPALRRGFDKWGVAVWAPDASNIKHSTHLDARQDDPKYPMYQKYDGVRPDGAPPEGWFG